MWVWAPTRGKDCSTPRFIERDDLSEGEEEFYPETVTAVPGTNFTNLSEVGTSVMDLHERSCLFDVMLALARRMLNGSSGRYAFAGHSLGGSVAQYVAQQLGLPEDRFIAYAFNGIGIDECRGSNPTSLKSFFISGDPVVRLGNAVGRIQGGEVVEYTPPEATGFLGRLNEWWDVLTFRWHRRPGVQEGLCDCMKERGALSIQ